MWQIVHPIPIHEVYMSYFKLIPSKSAKAYKNLTKNLNISDQFKKINDLILFMIKTLKTILQN